MSGAIVDALLSQAGSLRGIMDSFSDEFAGRQWSQAPAPVGQFFENLEKPPTRLRSVAAWKERVSHNSRLFQTNYLIIVGLFLLFYIVTHPLSVLIMFGVAAGCITAASPNPPMYIQGRLLSPQERLVAAAAVSSAVLCIFGVFSSLTTNIMLSTGVCTVHATVRRVGTAEKVEELKEKFKEKIEELKGN